ncbi:MAG: S8 family serine peptidase, partial [Phycisphaerales bacterium]|nr:S8 family serine peptidase [Phycisphaerales bacterium]
MSAIRWRARRALGISVYALVLTGLLRADNPAPSLERGAIDVFSNQLPANATLSPGYYVVRLSHVVSATGRAALNDVGVQLLDALGPDAWLARFDLAIDTSELDIISGAWAYVADARISTDLHNAVAAQPGNAPIVVDVTLFEQCDEVAVTKACAARAGAPLRSERIGDNLTLTFATDIANAESLATIEDVQFIEPAPTPSIRNNDARWTVQSDVPNHTPFYDHGLAGYGEIIGIVDHQIDMRHCSFADEEGVGAFHRKLIAYFSQPGSLRHGTHVAGIAAGDGGDFNTRRGVAYEARIAYSPIPSFNETGVLETLARHSSVGARIHNNSWGDDTTGAYNALPRAIDSYMWEHEDELVVLAITNDDIIRNPENAKNAIAVGAADHYPNENTHCRGGTGPTLDGRRKPDVMASGCSVLSSAYSTDCGARVLDGTSMAAPAVSAAAALIREYYRDGYYPTGRPNPNHAITPSGALLKATLINSAQDMIDVLTYPSPQEGWGRVVADEAVYFPGDSRTMQIADVRNADGINTGESFVRDIVVDASDEPLRVTLVWTEPPAAAGAAAATVNNLDLIVTGPDGSVFPGNLFAGGVSNEGATFDPINNVEQVIVTTPPIGLWRIEARGTAVAVRPQGLAIVASGALATEPGIDVVFVQPLPESAPSDQPVPVDIEVFDDRPSPGPFIPTISWRVGPNRPFVSIPMQPFGAGWRALLPGAECGDAPQWRLNVVSGADAFTWPASPLETYTYEVGELTDILNDDMEIDRGWTVGSATDTASAGVWLRGAPVATMSKPPGDHTATGVSCWVTGTAIQNGWAGDYDVDGGATTLTSPPIDLSHTRRATISYWRWYSNKSDGAPADDTLL